MDRLALLTAICVGMLFAEQATPPPRSAETVDNNTASSHPKRTKHAKKKKSNGTANGKMIAPPTAPNTPIRPYPPTKPGNNPGQVNAPPGVPKPPE